MQGPCRKAEKSSDIYRAEFNLSFTDVDYLVLPNRPVGHTQMCCLTSRGAGIENSVNIWFSACESVLILT